MTPVALGVLAVVLAGPAPSALARAARTRRTPRTAMLLWQALALAAVLSAVGAGLALATDRAWRGDPNGLSIVVAVVALGVTALVVGRLLLSAHRLGRELRVLRRRHRAQVDLVARRDGVRPGVDDRGVRVLEHELPVAYCLPGGHGRVVVSAGTIGRLGDDELQAVLAHERAHLRARHDLVLEAFAVLHRAFPRWVSSRTALAEVRLLAEVLADRAAARGGRTEPLARALVAVAEARAGQQGGLDLEILASGEVGPDLVTRVQLLVAERTAPPHRVQTAVLLVAAVAVLVVPTAVVVAPWLAALP